MYFALHLLDLEVGVDGVTGGLASGHLVDCIQLFF